MRISGLDHSDHCFFGLEGEEVIAEEQAREFIDARLDHSARDRRFEIVDDVHIRSLQAGSLMKPM